jgi:hypothetical protein
MGQAFAFLLDTAENEFLRVQGVDSAEHAGRAITYQQLRQMRLPEDYTVNTKHLAVLFCIDANNDGVVSYDDLRNFISWAADVLPPAQQGEEFAAALEARCMLRLWSRVRSAPRGNDILVDWVLLLVEKALPKHVQRPVSKRHGGGASALAADQDDSSSSDDGASMGSSASQPEEVVALTELNAAPGEGENAASASHYGRASQDRRFGMAAVAFLYDLLQLDSVYGLAFPAFHALLMGAGSSTAAVNLPRRTQPNLTHSGEGDVTTDSDDGISSDLMPSFDHAMEDGGGDTPSNEAVWVEEEPLRAFLDAFALSMWATLHRLGLHILTDDTGLL